MRKFYLIAFDISNDKIRRRVVKLLESNTTRVQKSVFESWLTDKQYIELKHQIDNLIDYSTDSVRYYNLCQNCIPNIRVSGFGIYTEKDELIVL
ncbi:MAG: CRISPR-associated endonuclease Cas2 [Candidatus Cloacimonadales bacterium]|nr:CRISPR-associated endonuclease Cas2 [Candidatus Cloacimonadota bacterium]MDD2651131.1 CRISPR-associated endonuclease Cas2 [Candidatus Cloacimonadota bacterium]MDX9977367.1 CRISPR-associated endonuclease Cas2 [Candidatus Cloacimonadales bacterium]